MKFKYLYIICLLISCYACNEQDFEPSPVPTTQRGDLISINVATRALDPDLPSGANDFYGMYCLEHATGTSVSWYNPIPTVFYSGIENIRGQFNSGDKLIFDGNPRYPINDSLSVFLYYPYDANATLDSIAVKRMVKKDDATGTITIADKYPDYLAGKKAISVIGGTPEDPNEASVPLKHLMSRIRFRLSNPGADPITLTQVNLNGIKWKGTINPQITVAEGFFTPAPLETPESLVLIENFQIEGTAAGLEPKLQHMQIDSIYNYSDVEARAGDIYDEDFYYYLLVPPLDGNTLKNVSLEIVFERYGNSYTVDVQMQQIKIPYWLPGHTYCYTIAFNTYMIEYIDAIIKPWNDDEEIYNGFINL